jgi:hypothetical protein
MYGVSYAVVDVSHYGGLDRFNFYHLQGHLDTGPTAVRTQTWQQNR